MKLLLLSVGALAALQPPFFLAADGKEGGGGAPKPLPIGDQLTSAQARVTELEGLQAAWNGDRSILTSERDTARGQITTLQGQLQSAAGEQSKLAARVTEVEGQLATSNTNLTAMTAERDRFKTLAETPSAQARTILAAAGSPSVPMQASGTGHPGNIVKTPTANMEGKTGLQRALAKALAAAAEKKG